jgi:UDP-N-acetylglucosamine acyltransferase
VSALIHPTAIIDSRAELADGVSVGPYAIVGPGVRLGRGCSVGSHAVIQCNTVLGEGCKVFPHATLGFDPQDLKFKDEVSWFEAGEGNIFREFCSMNRGTGEGGRTQVGSHNLFMAYTHLGHDCHVGSHVIMSNNASLAGHCEVEDHVIMAGFAAAHQYTRIGEYAMVGGAAVITKDVCPYVIISGDIAKLFGLNVIGLKRAGFSAEEVAALEGAYKLIFRGKLNTTQALEAIGDGPELSPRVRHLTSFIKASQRGIHK